MFFPGATEHRTVKAAGLSYEDDYKGNAMAAIISGGRIEILLITSRRKTRWVLPKGVVEPDLAPSDSAVKEAWEEAGLEGTVSPQSIGTYEYEKWGGVCSVQVFPLLVEDLAESWPESHRDRRWFGVSEAARRVDEPELKALITRSTAALLSRRSG